MDDDLRPAEWFRPGQTEREKAAAGTYSVSENGVIEAWLHGSWHDVPSIALAGIDELVEAFPEVVYGDAFGRRITLVGTSRGASRTNSSTRQQRTRIDLAYGVEGLWLAPDELALTKAVVRFIDQDLWSSWGAYPAQIKFEEGVGIVGLDIRYEEPEPLEALLDGGVLRLKDASTHRQLMNPSGWVLKSASDFVFEFDEPVDIEQFQRQYLMPLEVLITSATGRRSGVAKFRATNRAWVVPSERHHADRWITVNVGHVPTEDGAKTSAELLHRVTDFDFAAQLPIVFDVAQLHRYPLEHYGTLRRGVSAGYLADFIAAAQLCESFHRTLHPDHRDDMSLDARLTKLDQESGGLLKEIVGDKEWHKRLARLRNIVAHGLRRSEALTSDVRSVQAGTRMLLLLFEVRFLVALGFTAEKARGLAVDRGSHGWIALTIKENYPHIREMTAKDSTL
ncbi:hypothetical protein KIN34_02435 [Cellulomonas sp. DKR-3]|uniref:ApeA N-terminal domain-containing protein n=1 Tax=Cellulomonas fulva TaxID=2835530 RepID=A0ABS5TVL1_9CELL|nr:HEPN domain-containing protein [Cellulomonas fulva]MBT0993148.1 hypothetical protein [Cellulomonas fulva]